MVGETERRARFAYALAQAIAIRGISERQLAKDMGLDPRKIAGWRSGKRLPDYYETIALASQLRVNEELFRNPPPVPEPPPYPIEQYLTDAVARGVGQGLSAQTPDEGADDAPGVRTLRPRRSSHPG